MVKKSRKHAIDISFSGHFIDEVVLFCYLGSRPLTELKCSINRSVGQRSEASSLERTEVRRKGDGRFGDDDCGYNVETRGLRFGATSLSNYQRIAGRSKACDAKPCPTLSNPYYSYAQVKILRVMKIVCEQTKSPSLERIFWSK